MDENNLINIVNILNNDISSSSSDTSNDSSSISSSSSSTDENYNPLEDDLYEEDVLFPILQILLNNRRRHHVDNFLNVVHLKSDQEFREDFRLTRATVYGLIGNYY